MKRKAPTGARLKAPAATSTAPAASPDPDKPKRRKLREDTSDTPNISICWAQLYRYPYWPAKIVDESDIPQEILEAKPEKKSKDPLICVEFYGNHDFGWVSSAKIQEFMIDQEGPPGHMKSDVLSPQLLVAMEEARQDLLGYKIGDPENGLPPQPLNSNGMVRLPNFVPFPNLGNTCYVNSALQCLHQVPLFCAAVAESTVGEDTKQIDLLTAHRANGKAALDDDNDDDNDDDDDDMPGRLQSSHRGPSRDEKDSDTTTGSTNGESDASGTQGAGMPQAELVHSLRLIMKILNDPGANLPGYEPPSLYNTAAAAASLAWAQLNMGADIPVTPGFGILPGANNNNNNNNNTTSSSTPVKSAICGKGSDGVFTPSNRGKSTGPAQHMRHPTLINDRHARHENHQIIVANRDEEDEEVDIMQVSPTNLHAPLIEAPIPSSLPQQSAVSAKQQPNATVGNASIPPQPAGPTTHAKRGERLSPTGKRSTRNSRNRLDSDAQDAPGDTDSSGAPTAAPSVPTTLDTEVSDSKASDHILVDGVSIVLLTPPAPFVMPKQGRGRPSKAKKEALAAAAANAAAAAAAYQQQQQLLYLHQNNQLQHGVIQQLQHLSTPSPSQGAVKPSPPQTQPRAPNVALASNSTAVSKPRVIRDEVERLRADHKPDKDRNSAMQKELRRILLHFKHASGGLLDEKYYTDQHQDISEFIMLLLEYTHQHLRRQLRSHGPQHNHLHVSGCPEWNKYVSANFSPVVASFDGLLRRSRTCPRGHEFQSHEVFRILTLHFHETQNNSGEVTLEDMLRQLKQPEVLECRCSKCGGSDNKHFRQVTDVYVCPKYMIITLGRFKSAMKQSRRGRFEESRWWAHKIKTTVKFPLNSLDVSTIFEIAPGQETPVYNLVAISNHKGSLNGGHYFSYVRQSRDSQQWFSLNDQSIRTVRNSALVSNQAYMLFYERIG